MSINRQRGPKPKPIEDRFWPKVDKNGPVPAYRPDFGPCWLWTAKTTRGYGKIGHGSRIDGTEGHLSAHRVSYEIHRGPIPDGLEIDHLCRVRKCVNPDHLEPVTHIENIRRGETGQATAVRQRAKTHCPKGHPYSGSNLVVETNGSRGCRTCRNERTRLWARGER